MALSACDLLRGSADGKGEALKKSLGIVIWLSGV
jgi:hypothetical protein